jgi:alpha-D-xyloside xylohydrolase
MNYNGEDVELAQHNMDIAVPYLLSTRGTGCCGTTARSRGWAIRSRTEAARADGSSCSIRPESATVRIGWRPILPRRRAAVARTERTIDYQYIRDQARWPRKAHSRRRRRTRASWSGSATRPRHRARHKFRLYLVSYAKVFADGRKCSAAGGRTGTLVPQLRARLEAGKPVELRVEWEPNQGYIALYHADPLPDEDRHSVSFASEAGKAIDYYVVPGANMDALVAGYRRLTGKAPLMPRWAYGFWHRASATRRRKTCRGPAAIPRRRRSRSTRSCKTGSTGPRTSGAATASIRRAFPIRRAWSMPSTRSMRG